MKRRDAIRAVMAMPAVTSIAVAKVEPDDVIVLECDHALSAETAERIQQYASQVWPGRKIIVLGDGLKMRIAKANA